jgi:hypothetical protein
MKVAPNNLIYLHAKFQFFMKPLAIYLDLILVLLCLEKE